MKTPFFLLVILPLALASPAFAQTSETEDRYKRFLERFPESDANKDGVLTHPEATVFLRKRREELEDEPELAANVPKPTHADVSYGDHGKQAFDIWLADSKDGKPAPLCIYIHGGGFRGGDKSRVHASELRRFLDAGISYVSMNYRLSDGGKHPYPAAMHDSARGLQMIRSKAGEWNIDPERIACYGGSAGAGISLWLAFHEDLADPDSKDPVARQSTRIVAAGTNGGQSTYDMHVYREWFGVPDLPPHDALDAFFAIQKGEDMDSERVKTIMHDASPITHLTRDDVPVYMEYGNRPNSPVNKETTQGEWVHHPLLGIKLREAMSKLGLDCYVNYRDNEEGEHEDMTGFLMEMLRGGHQSEGQDGP
ncbi:MAG: alpha/beta hydrolase [Verrucomicrobiota bacterium]